jgi:hypothetical protein
LLSKTAVSEIGARLWADDQKFCRRDLGEHEIVYLFFDGIAERIRPGQKREPVLAAPSRPPGLDPFRVGSRRLLARDGASPRTARRFSRACLQSLLAMVDLGVWASGSGLFLGVSNGLSVAELDALDKLAEAVGAIEPAPVTLGGLGALEDPQRPGGLCADLQRRQGQQALEGQAPSRVRGSPWSCRS